MKKLLTGLLIFLLILLLCVPALADTEKNLIHDDADLLTDAEQTQLQQKAAQISNEYRIELTILTVSTTNGHTTQRYAEQYYQQNGLGVGEENSGILLLIAMDSATGRGWYIYTYPEGYDAVSDERTAELMEDVTPQLSKGKYADAFHTYLDLMAAELKDYRETTPDEVLIFVVIALGVGALVGLITVLIMRSGMKSAVYQYGAREYIVNGSYDLTHHQDIFLYSHVTKVRRSSSSSSGSRGGSGRSGGSGGSF